MIVLSLVYPPTNKFETVPLPAEPLRAECPWYAIRVRSKFENVASATLRGKGYEEFLPVCRSRRRWSDRVKELDLPLFPGYLFCRFDVKDRLLPILTTPGVVAIVGAGKTPVHIDDQEIEAIRAILGSGLAVQPSPFLHVGSIVYIEGGPLAGVEGIITNTDKVYRLVVSVSLLQRSIAVEIDRAWARPILEGLGPRAVTLFQRTRQMAQTC
jgi:transcription antitermination factor NusG